MLFENMSIAFRGLVANKLRTLLSVLGILIGVLSVTLLLAIGAGASKFVKGQVSQLGTNTIYVFLRDPSTIDAQTAKARKPAITRADLALMSDPALLPGVIRAVPEISSATTITQGQISRTQPVIGTIASWSAINNRVVTRGLMFTADDVTSHRRVAVIGSAAASRFFPQGQAVGGQLRIGTARYEVIGVFAKRGAGIAGDQDNVIVVPETAMSDTVSGTFESYSQVIIQLRPESVKTGIDRVTQLLLKQRNLTDKNKADFDTFDNAQFAATSGQISTVFSLLLGLIAGISLLVGGIGVMNIMLVTVTERTREIGIRKALGAKRWHLLTQFLVESVVLTGVGGILGAAIGAALSLIKVGSFTPMLAPWMVLLSVGVSAFIGVAFGVYPANKAAKLRPIDALRFE
jgi:putative ABC transport system permease protein